MALLSKLVTALAPRTFYELVLGITLPQANGKGDVKISCPFHTKRTGYEDVTGSMSISMHRENGGMYNCLGGTCGASGNMIKFYQEFHGIHDLRVATNRIITEFGLDAESLQGSIIDQKTILQWQSALFSSKDGEILLKHIKEKRCLSDAVINKYKLGLNPEGRLTIPVLDASGDIIDVRGWLPEYKRLSEAQKKMKMISVTNTGQNKLFPLSAFQQSEIYIIAGEMDALAMLSHDFNAVTNTSGEGKFNKAWINKFADKDVIVIQDADAPGESAANKLLEMLYPVAAKIKAVSVALEGHPEIKDTTDLIRHVGAGKVAKQFLDKLITETPLFWIQDTENKEYKDVSLYAAGTSELINQKISVTATVLGNESQDQGYYAVPKQAYVSCSNDSGKNCVGCPLLWNDGYKKPILVDLESSNVVDLLSAGHGTPAQEAFFKKLADVEGCRHAKIEVDESSFAVVEPLLLVPDTEISTVGDSVHFQRTAYHVGHGLRLNQRYKFRGRTVVDRNARVTHVFNNADPAEKLHADLRPDTEITLDGETKTVREHLSVFKARNLHPTAKLAEIYDQFKLFVTRVVGRDDVCEAFDLVYHSPLSFNFGERYIHWGWLSCFVFGDTQCAKSETLYRLRDHFRLGQVYNGESISRAGIVGAYTEAPGKRGIMWRAGIGPRNDGGLIAIDEFTGLSTEQIGELTYMRSTGKAQSTKVGMDNSMDARVRWIAISNPRSNRAMSTYNPGCKAIKEIIGGEADIARFDIFVSVATDEVKLDDIHAEYTPIDPELYTSDLCNALLQWVWTRKAKDYQFSDAAIRFIKDTAVKMAGEYTSAIPIIAQGSHHLTIARIAAAMAGRLYSTDDGFKVLVELEHAEAARDFLYRTYNKPSMGYNKLSAQRHNQEKLVDSVHLKKLLDLYPYSIYKALTENLTAGFSLRELADECALEPFLVRDLMQQMSALSAAFQSRSKWYTTKAFNEFAANGYVHPQQTTYLQDMHDKLDQQAPLYEAKLAQRPLDDSD